MTAIDVHAHVIVPELLRARHPAEAWRPDVRRDGGHQVVEFEAARASARGARVRGRRRTSSPRRSRAGIERLVLCPWVPLLFYDVDARGGAPALPPAERRTGPPPGRAPGSRPRARRGAAAGSRAGRGRAGSADDHRAASPASRSPPASAGSYLGDPRFEPFWTAAERTGALVFIHPTTRGVAAPAVFEEHYLWNLVGNPIETTITAAHLVLTGTMQRHPALRVLLAHGGRRDRLSARPAASRPGDRGRRRRGTRTSPADASIRRGSCSTR